MTLADIELVTDVTPDPDDAFMQLARILRHTDPNVLRYVFNTRRAPVRTASRHGIGHVFPDNPKCLLFYESGWVHKEQPRTYTRLFFVPQDTWVTQTQIAGKGFGRPPSIERYETADLLPVLQKLEFRGYVATRSIRRLLNLLRPNVKWSESWSVLCHQINQTYPE